jgi:hypothetical protein
MLEAKCASTHIFFFICIIWDWGWVRMGEEKTPNITASLSLFTVCPIKKEKKEKEKEKVIKGGGESVLF